MTKHTFCGWLHGSRALGLFFVLGLVCWGSGLSWGQEQLSAPLEDATPPAPVEPQSPEFKAAADELRQHLKSMREILVHFNTSSSPANDREFKQRWNELRETGVELHQKMVAAAVAEYRADPTGRPALADMLWEILDRNAEADQYEGMLEVALALQENGYQQEKLRGTLAMTAFALNEYDLALEHVDAMVNAGANDPQLLRLQEDLPQVKQAWEAELAARAADAEGEPLPRVRIKTTKGDMVVELFENQAPESVGNFLDLVESGFYERLTFHRVLKHFMAQTGCPVGDGTGGPGYMIYGEMEKPGARKFFRGTLGVALAQHPNSGGSQFFITFIPTYELNGDYTAFGRVISGIEVLSNLARIDPDDKEKKSETGEMPDEIISIEILNKRDHAYQPHKVQ